jgi:hypothetical protein
VCRDLNEERLKVMKSRYILRAIAIPAFCLLSAFTVSAQKTAKVQAALPPGPCRRNAKVCFQRINAQLGQLRAYVRHAKPGSEVTFNPQPDPPGDPDPWYRRAHEAYITLHQEFADLSESSPWGRSKWTWSQEQIHEWQSTVSDAQDKLNNLSLPAFGRNRASINETLDALSTSARRLSDSLATPQLRR